MIKAALIRSSLRRWKAQPKRVVPPSNKGQASTRTPAQKKAEEEASVKKRQQEEAELVALRAEVRRLQEELKATITVEKVKVTAKGVRVTIRTSESGTVTITGHGIRKLTRVLPAGTDHITVGLTKTGRAERREHRKIKLSMSLQVDSRSVSASQMIKLARDRQAGVTYPLRGGEHRPLLIDL